MYVDTMCKDLHFSNSSLFRPCFTFVPVLGLSLGILFDVDGGATCLAGESNMLFCCSASSCLLRATACKRYHLKKKTS